jgi:hypothetical protein
MAGVDDLVTVQKNGVVAVNALVQALIDFKAAYSSISGTSAKSNIKTDELLFAGSGRLVSISIITAAAGGTVHDVARVSEAGVDNTIYTIPNSTGLVSLGVPIANGLAIKPASGSVITIIYSGGD